MSIRVAPALAVAILLCACATPALRPEPVTPDETACLNLFVQVDAAVEHEGVRDTGNARVTGFPHLRANRLLADLRDQLTDVQARRYWVEQLARLDAQAREGELANLSDSARKALEHASATLRHDSSLPDALRDCRSLLLDADLAQPRRYAALLEATVVPDDYSLARRALGLYPLTRIPFAAGIREFERRVSGWYSVPLAALPLQGNLLRYAPAPGAALARREAAALIADASNNPLRIPMPAEADLLRLANTYAPVYEIDVRTSDDRIGQPYWPPQGSARVDTTRPRVYYRAAHTRIDERVLLQLVYTAWFPARPREGVFDLLGGELDALIWRVTLAPDGTPVLFDSIHACGCYHWFFTTPRVTPRPRPDDMSGLDEWLFIPQTLSAMTHGQPPRLRIASGTHYLQRVLPAAADLAAATPYTLVPETVLLSLPRPDGARRSLYGPDALVAGSERLERWLFWPMGIASPGAMRQWGRHPTAFVGRRHFDDARLIDERFEVFLDGSD